MLIVLVLILMVETVSGSTVQVSLTMRDGSTTGPVLPGVSVTASDGNQVTYNGVTDSNGLVVFNGASGTWTFSATKSGYTPSGSWTNLITISKPLTGYLITISQLPEPPTPLSPGTSVEPGTTITTLTPTLEWTAVSGADSYGIYIRDLNSNTLVFDSPSRGISITGTQYTLPSGVLENGKKYRWDMTSHSSVGWGSYSSPLYFQEWSPDGTKNVPTLTAPLRIWPVFKYGFVGDMLFAEFEITNIGNIPITLDKLLVSGRYDDGKLPNNEYPDFTSESITLQPNVPYHYFGDIYLPEPGRYHFFVAYYIANPSPEEKKLLDENNWNTAVDLGPGLTDGDRIIDIFAFYDSPPTFDPIEDKVVTVGQTLTFTISATDPENEILIYEYYQSLSGATLNPSTGEFSWTPSAGDVGDHSITFYVIEGDNGHIRQMDRKTIKITVTSSATNQPPIFKTIENKIVTVGQTLTFTLSASDPDTDDVLIYSYTPILTSATLNPSTGEFSWTPSAGDVGEHPITFKVTDGKAAVIQTILITVYPPNPEFTILDAKMVSPKKLGIGIELHYPDTIPINTKKQVTFSATINGITIPPQPFDITNLKQSDMYDANGELKPSTPLRIDLKKTNVPRFNDNIHFTLRGISTYEGGPLLESTKDVNILLPVVILHGFVPMIPKEDLVGKMDWRIAKDYIVKGYPGGITSTYSANPDIPFPIQLGFRPKFFEKGYKNISEVLIKNDYIKKKILFKTLGVITWDPDKNQYVTLWDPEDREIGFSSLSYATTDDITTDLDNIYKNVQEWSYADKMNIIGHSTGGLVARYYAWKTKGNKVNKVITVGTPHDGIARFYQEPFEVTSIEGITWPDGHSDITNIWYDNRQDFINDALTIPNNKNSNLNRNLIQWFVPRWTDAIDYSYLTVNPGDPDPTFKNTFKYAYETNTKYYLIYGNYPTTGTPYSVALKHRLNNKGKTVWYDLDYTKDEEGDGYVYINSAADRVHTDGQVGATIQWQKVDRLEYEHGYMLNDLNVTNYIINDLR